MAPISGRESAHVTKFNSITFGRRRILTPAEIKAPGKNRTHDQDPQRLVVWIGTLIFRCRVTVQLSYSIFILYPW